MKFLSYITAFLVMAGATCFGQGMRISAYPNTNNLAGTNLFIVAIKGSPGTNMNISWAQLSNLFNTTVGGQYVLEQEGRATNVTILQQTNLGSVLFATVTMPNSGSSGLMLHFATNLLFTNGVSWFEMNTNGAFGFAEGAGIFAPNQFVVGPSLPVIVKHSVTNHGSYDFTNVAMPYGGSSGIFMSQNTNLVVTNGAGQVIINTNGSITLQNAVLTDSSTRLNVTPLYLQSIGIGYEALNSSFGGAWNPSTNINVAIGWRSGRDTTTGAVTAVGYQAGLSNTVGVLTAFGKNAGMANVSGHSTFIGNHAGAYATTGNSTAVGDEAAGATTTGDVTAMGYYAARSNTTASLTAIGYYAASHSLTGAVTAVGYSAGLSNLATGLTAVGEYAAAGNILGQPTAFGTYAGYAANGNIVAVGYRAGVAATNNGTYIGYLAGDGALGDLIVIGHQAAYGTNTANRPIGDTRGILIGNNANRSVESATTLTNYVGIGDEVLIDTANTVRLGNTNIAYTYLQGNVGIKTETAPSSILEFGSRSDQTIVVQRRYDADLAGSSLVLKAGGATVGATDKAGGSLILSGGISTGGEGSQITFNTAAAGGSGTTDRAPATRWYITPSGNFGSWGDDTYTFGFSGGRPLSITIGTGNSTFAGKVGIGTNAPAATLHVAGNNAQPVLQAGTTNKPEQLVLSTNGVLSVNPGGGLNQLGCYGFLGMNDTNLIVCAGAAGVYTNVAGQDGFTTITTNGFFGNTAAIAAGLTNLYPGWYRITIALSAVGANNQAIEGEVFTNGVACDLIGFKKTFDAAARLDDMSMTGIIYLPANCGTQFMLQDGGTGDDVIVHRGSLTIGTP